MTTLAAPKPPTRFQVVRLLEKEVLAKGSRMTSYSEFKAESDEEQIAYLRWLYRNSPSYIFLKWGVAELRR